MDNESYCKYDRTFDSKKFSDLDKGNIVELLAKYGMDMNVKNEISRTPLHWAVVKNLPSATQSLIDAGADVNARDKQGNTPLHLVAHFSGEFKMDI